MRYPAKLLSVEPSVLRVGAVQVRVAEPLPLPLALTVIENAASDVVALPSFARITMFEYVPTCASVGVPLRRPVEVLKDAHAGLFEMLKVRESPFESLAVGVNEYAEPTPTEVDGVPEILGAVLDVEAALTAMEKVGSEVVTLPSLTRIWMLEYVRTWELEGVPESRPVEVLNAAHVGLLETLNLSLSPLASLALGVNE
jgi:hypothetical protein